ncbi:Spy/CpxP family protein refolding chaperone [Methylophaga sp. OBS1]|jgi:protein CpxP|uniref:Spy/CpxP family protein refolding chaperone n=1 Tax=Methylophaga sp. OBS1 TaxID=2991933 RepID=UPI00224C9A5F|nr:Spy/CpxP family protein refolding chaperone [Methylophaga sp. OBS1]MCX4193417.1 Spy/CpxP family protein refolding chaperone [Methylophaga sp. OBS1]
MKKLLIALCLLPLVSVAHAGDHDKKQCDGHKYHMKHKKAGDVPFYLRDIDLNETQKSQIKALMEKRHADRKANKQAYWDNKKAIYALTRADNLNEAELEKLVDESMAMKKQSAMERARFHHQVYNLLTAEQQQLMEAKLQKMREKHGK